MKVRKTSSQKSILVIYELRKTVGRIAECQFFFLKIIRIHLWDFLVIGFKNFFSKRSLGIRRIFDPGKSNWGPFYFCGTLPSVSCSVQ